MLGYSRVFCIVIFSIFIGFSSEALAAKQVKINTQEKLEALYDSGKKIKKKEIFCYEHKGKQRAGVLKKKKKDKENVFFFRFLSSFLKQKSKNKSKTKIKKIVKKLNALCESISKNPPNQPPLPKVSPTPTPTPTVTATPTPTPGFNGNGGTIPPPTNLVAAAISLSEIALSWHYDSDLDGGFEIERRLIDGSFSLIATIEPDQTFYRDKGLKAATTYYYRVRAFNEETYSDYSKESGATTSSDLDTEAPSAPQNLIAEALSAYEISLSWTASTDNVGVAGYAIYRDDKIIDISYTTKYTDTELDSLTTYSYQVTAYDDALNQSEKSNTANATTHPEFGQDAFYVSLKGAGSQDGSLGNEFSFAKSKQYASQYPGEKLLFLFVADTYGEIEFANNDIGTNRTSWEKSVSYKSISSEAIFEIVRVRENNHYLTLQGLHVIPEDKGPNSVSALIYTRNAKHLEIKDCTLKGVYYPCIADGLTDKGIEIRSDQDQESSDISIDGNDITSVNTGIFLQDNLGEKIVVKNNYIHDLRSNGIRLECYPGNETVLIEKNHINNQIITCDAHGTGIALFDDNAIVSKNIVRNWGGTSSIATYESPGNIWPAGGFNDLTIEGNLVYDTNNMTPLRLRCLGTRNVVRNNTIVGWYRPTAAPQWKYYNTIVAWPAVDRPSDATFEMTNNLLVGSLSLDIEEMTANNSQFIEDNNIIWAWHGDNWEYVTSTNTNSIIITGDGVVNPGYSIDMFEKAGNFFVGNDIFDTYSYTRLTTQKGTSVGNNFLVYETATQETPDGLASSLVEASKTDELKLIYHGGPRFRAAAMGGGDINGLSSLAKLVNITNDDELGEPHGKNLNDAYYPVHGSAACDYSVNPEAHVGALPCVAKDCSSDSDCNDSNECTNDVCHQGSCTHTNNNNSCDDGYDCTQNDYCSEGTCQAGTPNDSICLVGSCSGAICDPYSYPITGCGEYYPLSCQLPDGYISYWMLNDNALDENGLNDGNPSGVSFIEDAERGPVASFDGNAYIDVGTSKFNIDASDEFTISFWVKLKQYGARLIERGAYGYPFIIQVNDSGRIKTIVRTNTTNYFTSASSLELDTWYHIVFSYGNYSRTIYINGVAEVEDLPGSSYASLSVNNNENTLLGSSVDGYMDDVLIYNKKLDDDEIMLLFSSQNN